MALPTGQLGLPSQGQPPQGKAPAPQPMPQQPMPQQMAAMQGPPTPPPTQALPPGAMSAAEVVDMVKKTLQQKFRDPSFVVPVSISEAPVEMQMPGLLEPTPQPSNPFPALGAPGLQQGPVPPPSMEALPGLHPGSDGALPGPQGGASQGPQLGQPGLPQGFDPSKVLLM